MKNKIAIIDYEVGNVASVIKTFDFLGTDYKLTRNFNDIDAADFIVLPGVGSFQVGMEHLNYYGLSEFLTTQVVKNKKPFLGICLGMQLLATYGLEPVKTPGLNWIKGEVVKIMGISERIPHMGWNNIKLVQGRLLDELNNKDFYFIHSYHFNVEDVNDIGATVDYGKTLVACIEKDNIFATQFHPEKSQEAGLKLIRNFLGFYA